MANKCCSLSIALIACLVIFYAGSFGIANLYSVGLEQLQQRWNKTNAVTERELENASILARRMLSLHSEHPHYNSLAASLALRQSLTDTTTLNQHNRQLSIANDYYLKSITQRPIWPQSYTGLAKVAWLQGASQEQIFNLLTLSKRFGPFDATTLYGFAEIGLANWSTLNKPQQVAVLDAILQGMSYSRTRSPMKSIVTSPLQKARGCRLLVLIDPKTKRCETSEN